MSYEDPFEAQEPVEESQSVGTVTVDVKPNLTGGLEALTHGEHVVTLKGGRDYDAPWYVIHASGLSELEQLFNQDAGRLAALFGRIQSASKHFAGSAPPQTASAAQQQTRQAPAGAQEAPGGDKRFCSHGEMVFKSGISKAGKAYKLFSCTAPRESQCPAQFLN